MHTVHELAYDNAHGHWPTQLSVIGNNCQTDQKNFLSVSCTTFDGKETYMFPVTQSMRNPLVVISLTNRIARCLFSSLFESEVGWQAKLPVEKFTSFFRDRWGRMQNILDGHAHYNV